MKTKLSILFVFVAFLSIPGFAQEKTKKELKAEKELQQQKQTEALLDSRIFVFDAEKMNPMGTRTIILDYNTYSLKFNEENVVCDMPFVGRGYNVPYGGSDGGMKFKGKPENIKYEKNKKNYTIKFTVKGQSDVYDILVTVYFNGGANVSINSNNRGAISYDGKIRAPKDQENKQDNK